MNAAEPPFFGCDRLAILGLGLMGGSLAMALRGHCAGLLGIDPDPAAVQLALEKGVVGRAATDPAELLAEAEVIILAAPVNTILELLQILPELHPGPAVVLDLGSTKSRIVEAMEKLPERFDPIGGHPMCGKERSGLANADPALFRGAPFAFTPLARTRPGARKFASTLAQALGANPLWLDPATHDRWVAATSHLPYLVSNALAACTPLEAAPLVGSGFRSATRLAPTSASMMLDILMTNRENVLAALGSFRQQLAQVESLLTACDYPALQEILETGALRQQSLTNTQ
jgi:prephenate dehydrogenase